MFGWIQKLGIKIGWGFLAKKFPALSRYSPVVALLVLIAVSVLQVVGQLGAAGELQNMIKVIGLAKLSPITLEELIPITAQVVGVIFAIYGLIRLFLKRVAGMEVKRGNWQSYAPIIGELLICAAIVIEAFVGGNVSALILTLGEQFGLTQAAPIPVEQIVATGVSLGAAISVVRGVLRRVLRSTMVFRK